MSYMKPQLHQRLEHLYNTLKGQIIGQRGSMIPHVVYCAVTSRVLLIGLMIFWRTLFNPYDSSAPLNPSCISASSLSATSNNDTVVWPRVTSAIEGSIVWDAVYFVRIAQCGYEYEQSYAFLPLLPVSISILSHTIFGPLIPFIGQRAVLALSGYILNNIMFVLAAVFFYKLSVAVLVEPEVAWRASILFCYNPASVFYSSIYSESFYAFFSFGGLYYLISGEKNWSVLWFAISTSARSNGTLNAGYILFEGACKSYDAVRNKDFILGVKVLVADALRCLCIFIPFLIFQAFGYYNICFGHIIGEMRPWCKSRIPLMYSYIQSHYWGVGFLRYFRLHQIPNFLLASPMLFLAGCSVVYFVQSRPEIFSLGFHASCIQKLFIPPPLSSGASGASLVPCSSYYRYRKQASMEEDHDIPKTGNRLSLKSRYFSFLAWPFVLHLGFMMVTAFLVMHVQVATRFLSASPPIYWVSSYLTSAGHRKICGYIIWTYFAAYILIGSLLFSNFYPFT